MQSLTYRYTKRDLERLIDSARQHNVCEKEVVKRYCKYMIEFPHPDIKRQHEMAYNKTQDYVLFEGKNE